MSLEQALQENTIALNALTAQLAKGGAAPAATAAAKAEVKEKPAAKEKPPTKAKSEHTREEMVAVLAEVSEKHGKDAARALFVKGDVAKMAQIADADIDTVYAAAKAALEADDDM